MEGSQEPTWSHLINLARFCSALPEKSKPDRIVPQAQVGAPATNAQYPVPPLWPIVQQTGQLTTNTLNAANQYPPPP